MGGCKLLEVGALSIQIDFGKTKPRATKMLCEIMNNSEQKLQIKEPRLILMKGIDFNFLRPPQIITD